MRQIFSLPRRTHRYLIEPVSLCCHPKVMLAGRLVTFFKSLINSNKFAVRFLARLCQGDQRTVAGKTLTLLEEVCEMNGLGADSMTANTIKRNVQYFNAPVGEEWRAPLIRELLLARDGELLLQGFSKKEVIMLIEDVCVT